MNSDVSRAFYENSDLVIVSTTIDDNERFKLTIFIPKQEMASFIELLSGDTLSEWQDRTSTATGEIEFPLFDINTTFRTNDVYRELGINDLFNGKADLSNMISDNSFVSAITHISSLEIGGNLVESQTNVTENIVTRINKPFVYVIEDTKIDFITHIGLITIPNVSDELSLSDNAEE